MTTKGQRRATQGAVSQLAMSQSQGVGSPGAVEHVAEAMLSGSQLRGVGGRKRTRRDSAEPTRKSARGQKPRRSEKVLELYQMGFSEEVVDDAIRRFPSNVGLAATWLLESQGGLTATARETAATSSTQDKPPASSPVDAHSAAQPVVHASGAREEPSQSEDGAGSTTQFDLFDDLTVPATSCATPHPPAKGPLVAPVPPVAVASSTQGVTGSSSRSRKRSRTTEGAPSNRRASTSRRTRSMGLKSSESGLRSLPPAPGASEPAFEPVDGVRTGEVASQIQHGGGGIPAAEAHNVSPGEGVLTSPPAGPEELAHDPVPSLGGGVEASEAVRMTQTEWFADAQGDVDERRAGASVLLEQPGVQQEERRTHAPHANCVGTEELPAHAAPPSQVEAPEQSQLRREVQPKGLLGAQAGTGEGLRLVMEPYPRHVEKEQPPAIGQVPPARTAAAVAPPGVCVDFPQSPSCATPTAEHDPPSGFGSDEEKASGGLVLQADTEGPAEATPLSLQNPADDDVAFDYFLSQMSQADQTTDEISEPCTAKEGLTATALSSEKENLDTAGTPVVATPSTAAAKGLQFTDTGARGVRRTSQSCGHDGYVLTSPRATPDGRSAAFHEDRPPATLSSVACSGKSWWSVSGETPSPIDGAGGEPVRSEKRARTCGGTTEMEAALWPYDELQTRRSQAGACGNAARHNSEGTRSSPGGSRYWGKRSSLPTVVHVGNEDRSMPSAEGLRCSAGRDFVQGSITRGQGAPRSEDPPCSAAPRCTEPSEPSVPLASAVRGYIGHRRNASAARGRASGHAAAGKSAEAGHMHGSGPSVNDSAASAGSRFGSSAFSLSAPLRAGYSDPPFVHACDGGETISSDRLYGPQMQVEQQRAPEGPIGFSTGTGRRVAVSAASMARVNHLFEPRETASRSASLPSSGGPRRVSYNDRSGPVTALQSRASRPQQKATLGLQQTEPSIHRAEVVAARADTALSKFRPVQVALPDQPVTSQVAPALGPEQSLLRAVQRPARKGGTSAGQAANAAVIESNGSARAAAEALRDLQFSNTSGAVGFSTGRGQPVAVSAASLARVRHLFEPAADATPSATGRLRQPPNTSTRQSLAETGAVRRPSSSHGRGEEMAAIESAPRRQASVPSDNSDATCQPALPTTAPPAGSPLCPVAEPAGEHCAAIFGAGDLQVSSSTPAYVSVGFCTGSGRRVTVTEGSMARVSHLFEPTERDSSCGPGGGHRSLSAASNYGQDMFRKASRAPQQQPASSQLRGQAYEYQPTRQDTSRPGAAMGASGAAMVDEMLGLTHCARSSTAGDHEPHRAPEVQSSRRGGVCAAADEASRGVVDAGVVIRTTSASPPVLSDHGGAQQLQSALAGCGVSFSTGSGRRVAVSAASLARVSHLFEPQEEAKPRRGVPAVMSQKSNALVSRRPLSAAVGRERHSTDAGHEVSTTSSSSVAVAVGHISSNAAHAEEEGVGMDVAHPGGLAAGHSVGLGSTSASVAPVDNSTAGAAEDTVQRASASSGNAVISFSTGRGRAIAVSEASMARVSHLFDSSQASSRSSTADAADIPLPSTVPRAAASVSGPAITQPAVNQLSDDSSARGAQCQTTSCSAQSAGTTTGRRQPAVRDWSSVSPSAASFESGLVGQGTGSKNAAIGPPMIPPSAQESVDRGAGVSFSTGGGRRVAVSEASMARVRHLFEPLDREVSIAPLEPIASFAGPVIFQKPLAAHQQLPDDEGQGYGPGAADMPRQCQGTVGDARVNEHMPGRSQDAVSGEESAKFQLPPSGGISTAAVTAHSVTSMARVSQLFELREVHQADGSSPTPTTVHNQSAGSNGGNSAVTTPELATASAASSGVLPFEVVDEGAPSPFAGFSTGRGCQLTVSEESMAKTRHLFDEHEKCDEYEEPCGTKVQTGTHYRGADQVPEGTTETGDLSPSVPAPVKAQSEGPSWVDDAAGASCMHAVDRTIGGDGGIQEPPLAEPSGQTDTVVSSRGNGDEQPPHLFSSDDEDLLQALEAYEAGLAHGRPSDIVAGNADRHICDTTHVESMDVEQRARERANDAQPPDILMHELAPSNGPNVQTTPSAADSTTDAAGRPASPAKDLDLGELLADLKQERLRLWDLGPRPCDELEAMRQYVCPVVIAITSDNAHRLRFDAQGLPARLEDVEASNPAGEHLALPPDVLGRLVAGVMDGKDGRKPPLEKWFANHYRLIVWKLACLERAFPQRLGGRYLTEARVAAQMRYRYDREVAGGARPAVRLVCNGDAPATRRMILCVSKVYPPLLTTPDGELIPLPSAQDEADADKLPPISPATTIDASDEAERPQAAAVVRLELTDGWYCIDAVLDEALSALAVRGRIRVGVKLAVCNASLQNASGGIEPLEIKADDPESRPYLRMHYNATRLTRWHARLGFQRSTNLPLPVSGLLAGGGIVSCVHAVVMRRYETKYLERRPRGKDGGMVIRILSQAEEDMAQAEYEAACQTALEKLSDEMLQEYEKRVAQDGGEALLPDQHRLQWQEQMEEARRKVLDDPVLHRESSPFFRVRICTVKSLGRALHPDWQFHRLEHVRANVAVLSVWNITDALADALQEGAYVALYSLSAPAPRDKASVSSTLRLNASSSTRVQLLSRLASQPLLRYCRFEPRQITSSIRLLRHMFDPGLGPFVCRDFNCVATLVSFYEWEVPKHKRKTGHRDRVRDDDGGNDKAPYVTRFFFLDPSRCILCVERRDYGQPAANTMPAVGGIFLLTDLAFESYDLKTDTVLARLSPNSTMRRVSQSDARRSSFSLASSSQGCPAYARGAMQHFCDWFSSADAAPVRAREEARLSSLLRDVSSWKSDQNADSPASAGTARRAQVYDYREQLIGLLRLEETKASIESRTLSLEVNVIGAGARRVVCDTMQSLKALAGGLWQGLPEYMRSTLLEANILRELVESEPPQSPQTVATATNGRTGQEQPHLQQGRPWPGASLAAQMVTWAEGLLCTQTFEVLVQRFQSECSQEDVYEVIELRVLHTLDE